MSELTWEQQLVAIKAFAGDFNVSLKMRKPGDWYVEAHMSLGGDGMLLGTYGNGRTPEEAVEDHWRIFAVEIPDDRYVVATGEQPYRRARWNGFMWSLLSDEQAESWRDTHHASLTKPAEQRKDAA